MQYRLYLLDSSGKIAAADSFAVDDDADATQLAADLYDACSDVFGGYELWQGAVRVVAALNRPPRPLDFSRLTSARQAMMLEVEERLSDTFDCIRRSKRLIETAAALLERS